MSADTLQAIGTLVGVVAVVTSVLGLANGIRQNTRALRTQNYTKALERVAAIQSRLSADAEMSEMFAKGARDASRLTPEERIQFTWVFYEMFGGFEFMLDQHQEGALPDEVWERWSATLAWWISLPGVQAWWRARPAPFSADFTAYVDDVVERPRFDVEADERWRRFLATGEEARPPGDPSPDLSPASP